MDANGHNTIVSNLSDVVNATDGANVTFGDHDDDDMQHCADTSYKNCHLKPASLCSLLVLNVLIMLVNFGIIW